MVPHLPSVVSKQLPEFIREDYPTFVAFVEAYYEYLQSQGVDFSTIRDIDETLEDFVVQFKKELAYNLPVTTEDERFLLQRIKDQYLAKGSEGSYKLLFKLLFGKNVELTYPGQQMLRASDGRWNQEVSIFVQVDYGTPEDVVGKLIDIVTPTRVLKVLVDRRQDIVGEIDRIVKLGGNIYEFYLDRKFVGTINPGDVVRYKDSFQATILPTTSKLSISQAGRNFRVGQLFEIRSGNGTGALMKVTRVTDAGGVKSAEFIKFGVGYISDFSVSVMSTNTYTAIAKDVSTSVARAADEITIRDRTPGFNEQGYVNLSDYFEQFADGGLRVGTITTTTSSPIVTGVNTSFTSSVIVPKLHIGEQLKTAAGVLIGYIKSIDSATQITLSTNAMVAVTAGAYRPWGAVADGTYAGTVLREFSLNYKNAQQSSEDPVIVDVKIGAIAKYPGYFETNAGFLSDAIFIQDSEYYQAFSYVVKIDERLSSYKSAVKTMLHPAGMALFGEFNILNKFDLSVTLQSLAKSLGIGLEDVLAVDAGAFWTLSKDLTTVLDPLDDTLWSTEMQKPLEDSIDTPEDAVTHLFGKHLIANHINYDLETDSEAFSLQDAQIRTTTKSLASTETPTERITSIDVDKVLATTQIISEVVGLNTAKYLYTAEDPDILDPQSHQGYVQMNSYSGQDYIVFEDEYSVGSRTSTFTTP